MTKIFSEFDGSLLRSMGFEEALLYYIQHHGTATSLDKIAHELCGDPKNIRRCAHAAEAKGLLKLTRLEDKSGRPYRVSALEERHEN